MKELLSQIEKHPFIVVHRKLRNEITRSHSSHRAIVFLPNAVVSLLAARVNERFLLAFLAADQA